MLYRLTTNGAATSFTNPLTLVAEDALHLAQRATASGRRATVTDVDGNVVSLEELREAARRS